MTIGERLKEKSANKKRPDSRSRRAKRKEVNMKEAIVC